MTDLWKGKPAPIDWADVAARKIVDDAFMVDDSMISIAGAIDGLFGSDVRKRVPVRHQVAWAMSIAFAQELRGIRCAVARIYPLPPTPPDWLRTLYEEVEAAWGDAADGVRLARDPKARLDATVDTLLKIAEALDGRGDTHEANALRDAAGIVEENERCITARNAP